MKLNASLIFSVLILFLLAIPAMDAQKARNAKETKKETGVAPTYEEHLYDAVEWRPIGPYRGGRSAAVTGVAGKPNLYYFGATGGGVWRTKDGGVHWENISDGYFGGSIGSVAVAPSDPNVLYVGGGECTVRGNVSYGYGAWRSTDAGETWSAIGLENARHIPRMRVDPTDPDIVYAAVLGDLYKPTPDRGVYKSKDGGNTWKKVLFANENAGAMDLLIDPNNPRIIYATTWNVRRTPYSLSSGGEGSAIWKSKDSGETWEDISGNKGLPGGIWGISGIAVSPVNSDRIWAIIENEKGGVFRSDDAGKTWQKLNEDRALRQRAWYYSRIYADPQDEDIVYVMNVSYHKSKDGGKTFESANAPHGDHHDLWIAPEDPDRMIVADDGGAQITFDGGINWSTYFNQPTAQFYRVTTDNRFPYRIYVAQQDNSTLRIAHRSGGFSIDEDDWESTAGCECGHIAIHPQNQDIVFGGCYDGLLQRLDHETGFSRAVNVWPDNPMGHGVEEMKYRFQWNYPIFFSPHHPNKLYTASNHLHVSYDEGESWQVISPDLTTNDATKMGSSGGPITKDNTSVEYYCTIFAAAESPRVKDLLWVGSDDGLVHVSRDGGENWKNVTPAGMPEWMMINSIEPDPHHDGGCYIAGTRYKLGDYTPYLYRTMDYGKTWTKITDGIKDDHFTRVLRVDPVQQGILYAGTETGMYISFDDGNTWQSMQLNLPVVPITDLAVKNNNLIAATQGRSLWMIDDLTVFHQLNKSLADKDFHLFKPMDSYRMQGGQNKKVRNAGLNHPGGVMVYYNLKELSEKDTVALTFLESGGDTIVTYSTASKEKAYTLEPKKGSNFFNWNMMYPPAKKFDGMVLWWASLNGPKAIPGDYQVSLSVNGKVETQPFRILMDPRSPSSMADYQKQYAFVREVRDKMSEAHETIIEIRDMREQLKNYEERTPDDGDLKNKVHEIDSVLTRIEESLYQTKNRSNQDPLNFPIRLTNKLGHLNSLVGGSEYPPTQQAYEVRDELSKRIDHELRAFEDVKQNMIPDFNEIIRAKSIDAIITKTKKPVN